MAYQYDTAAARLGRYCAAMLAQTDKHGKPRHTLDALIAGRPDEKRYATDFDRLPLDAG